MKENATRSTIGLRMSTKEKLDQYRAPGQCYDGFISQMIDIWEQTSRDNPGRVRGNGK